MSQAETITLLAAVISAFFGIIGVLLAQRNSRMMAREQIVREILIEQVNEIGGAIYHILAISQKMVRAKSDTSFSNFRKMAIEQQNEINRLRSKLRYSLWGLDDGFLAIRSTPFYVVHFKNRRDSGEVAEIMRLSTKLRESIDVAILKVLISGRPPSLYRRCIVSYRAYRLRAFFECSLPRVRIAAD